jgi:hypothetical protein
VTSRSLHRNVASVIIAGGLLTGCARTADMMPLNDAATVLGIPKLDVALYGTGYGPATVTMPDGEILNGHYHLAIGGAVSTGFGVASSRRGIVVASDSSNVVPMQNPFMLQAAGGLGGTTMTCEGSAGGLGHGGAVCTTNRGAQYQMMF